MKLKPTNDERLIDCLLLTLTIFLPYHKVAQHTFTYYDDNAYLFENPHLSHGLTWDSVVWAFTNTELCNWHPLTWISHLIDCELFGPHPGGYLLMNVAWHTLAACLCYLAFFRCTQSRGFALTVALIFALHPVNVENVAWASERKSLLNAVFWFAALIAYLDFIDTKSLKAYGFTVILFILSLFSKSMSVTLPCTLVLIHCLYLVYHPNGCSLPARLKQDWKQIIRPILPLLVLSLYFSAVTTSAQSIAISTDLPLAARLINAPQSYERYLVMFFHPTELAVFYPLRFDGHLDIWPAASALLLLIGLSCVALRLSPKTPQLAIGWCWFLGTMVPVLGFVQVGGQSHADRYLYIPMLGLAFIFPVLFEKLGSLVKAARNTLIGISLTVLVIAMTIATQFQVSYWQDGVILLRHSLAVTGYCFYPLHCLMVTYAAAGRYNETLAYIDSISAAEKDPLNRAVLATLKGITLHRTGRYQAAIEEAQRAIDLGYSNRATNALLAYSSYKLGQTDKAAQYFARAKAIRSQKGQNSFLAFPLDPELDDSFELRLKQCIPPQ